MLTCHYATQFQRESTERQNFASRSNGILPRNFTENYKLLQSTLVSFQFSSIVWQSFTALGSFSALTYFAAINNFCLQLFVVNFTVSTFSQIFKTFSSTWHMFQTFSSTWLKLQERALLQSFSEKFRWLSSRIKLFVKNRLQVWLNSIWTAIYHSFVAVMRLTKAFNKL